MSGQIQVDELLSPGQGAWLIDPVVVPCLEVNLLIRLFGQIASNGKLKQFLPAKQPELVSSFFLGRIHKVHKEAIHRSSKHKPPLPVSVWLAVSLCSVLLICSHADTDLCGSCHSLELHFEVTPSKGGSRSLAARQQPLSTC